MKRILALAIGLLLGLGPAFAPAPRADDDENPHRMTLPDGEPDLEKCDACHDDDLGLLEPKEELCLLCHSVTEHAGSAEHGAARPGDLERIAPEAKSAAFPLPLTDDGGIYCGTCHLFHDPGDEQEPWLAAGAPARTTAFAVAVRADVERERDRVAGPKAAHFVAQGSRALRKPVTDGSLCLTCHQGVR